MVSMTKEGEREYDGRTEGSKEEGGVKGRKVKEDGRKEGRKECLRLWSR